MMIYDHGKNTAVLHDKYHLPPKSHKQLDFSGKGPCSQGRGWDWLQVSTMHREGFFIFFRSLLGKFLPPQAYGSP